MAEIKNKLGFAESILKAVTVPCLVADIEGRITFVNPPLSLLIGAGGDYKGLLGKPVPEALTGNADLAGQLTGCLTDRTCRVGAELRLDDRHD